MSDFSEQPSAPHDFEREELAKAFREVFSLASGKRVLFWMLEQCSIYQEAYAGEMTNATNYTLGLQGAGRRLIGKLDQIDPTMYPKLLLAIADLKATEQAAAKRAAGSEEGEEYDAYV